MELLEILKQFKTIQADKGFTEKSRGLVLRSKNTLGRNVFEIFTRTLEAGASLALAGLLIAIILGGVSRIKVLEPLEIAAIDPTSIRAEAEAIDIQIQLTSLGYEESEIGAAAESTIPQVKIETEKGAEPQENKELSVEEALQILSQ